METATEQDANNKILLQNVQSWSRSFAFLMFYPTNIIQA